MTTPLPRWVFPLLVLVFVGCPAEEKPALPSPAPPGIPERECPKGAFSPFAPVICAKGSDLIPDPKRAEIYDVEEDAGKPSNRPVVVKWMRDTAGPLYIKFKNNDCVDDPKPKCDGQGGCVTVIKTVNWDEVEKKTKNRQLVCTYDLFDKVTDPQGELIVNPCCN